MYTCLCTYSYVHTRQLKNAQHLHDIDTHEWLYTLVIHTSQSTVIRTAHTCAYIWNTHIYTCIHLSTEASISVTYIAECSEVVAKLSDISMLWNNMNIEGRERLSKSSLYATIFRYTYYYIHPCVVTYELLVVLCISEKAKTHVWAVSSIVAPYTSLLFQSSSLFRICKNNLLFLLAVRRYI